MWQQITGFPWKPKENEKKVKSSLIYLHFCLWLLNIDYFQYAVILFLFYERLWCHMFNSSQVHLNIWNIMKHFLNPNKSTFVNYINQFIRLEALEQVFEAPRMYVLAVLEIFRRRSFSFQFLEVWPYFIQAFNNLSCWHILQDCGPILI